LLEIAACLSLSVFVLFYAYTSGTMTLRLYEKKNVIPEALGVEWSLSAYDTYLPLAAMACNYSQVSFRPPNCHFKMQF